MKYWNRFLMSRWVDCWVGLATCWVGILTGGLIYPSWSLDYLAWKLFNKHREAE